MLLLNLALLAKPSYPKYQAEIIYRIPWMNNTQWVHTAWDGQQGKQIYNFYNRSKMQADSTYIYNGTYQNKNVTFSKYARTEKNTYGCVYSYFQEDLPFITFIPNLDQYEELETKQIEGQTVRHFRQSGTYTTNDTDPLFIEYTEARNYQRNFYCRDENDICIPVKWELYSKSNFNSHFDVYIINYYNFTTNVKDSEFTLYDFNGQAKCPQNPDNGEDPSGPQKRSFPLGFLLQHDIHDLKGKHNLQKIENIIEALKTIKNINENKEFTFKAAQNHLVGLKREEILRFKGGKAKRILNGKENDTPTYNYTYLYEPLDEDLPESLDWRMNNIGHVKDQLFCGSCWTFSAIGCLESRINLWYRQNDPDQELITLSEQSVVDCFWKKALNGSQTSSGCEGGDENDVLMTWAQQQKQAFALQSDYPYLGQNDYCKPELEKFTEFKVKKAHLVPPGSVTQLKRALLSGPVAVGISVPQSLLYFAGGVYNDPACGTKATDIDHAVLAVGWGVDEKHGEYWIIRNSWSPIWGDNGYIYISTKGNLCGVTTMPAYVEIEHIGKTDE